MSQFRIGNSEFYDENKPFTQQLGAYMPPFSLDFFDDGGNSSCAFRPPQSAPEEDELSPEDSFDLNDARGDDSSYWIRITSRDEGMNVEMEESSGHYVEEFKVPKVRFICFC